MADHSHVDGLPSAKSISSSYCEHGTVFVHFHDATGAVIAQAAMPASIATDFISDLIANTEAALAVTGPAPGESGTAH